MHVDFLRPVLLLLVALALSGCGFIPDQEPTDDELRAFFTKHQYSLERLVEFCINVPMIRWIGLDKYDLYNRQIDTGINFENAERVMTTQGVMRDLQVESMACARNFSLPDAPLVAVTIPVFNAGLSIGGRSKGFRYLTEHAVILDEHIISGKLILIDQPNWYIYRREDQ